MINQEDFLSVLSCFSYEARAALYLYYKDGGSGAPKTVAQARELRGIWTEYRSIRDYNTAKLARGKPSIALWRNCRDTHIVLPTGGAVIKDER